MTPPNYTLGCGLPSRAAKSWLGSKTECCTLAP